ncbi:MAG: polysaccharide deacetylase family protein [Terriglobia bacterium]
MKKLHSIVAKPFCLLALVIFCAGPSQAQQPNYAQRLGYASNAKLLIIHGDDLAAAHSVDQATFKGLTTHALSSASVIVPAPWLTEVAAWSKQHADADIGIHIALTSEWEHYRWRPVAPVDQVPSLLDPEGYMWATAQLAGEHENAAEAYREMREQVEWAERLGIHPTHMDTHMGTVAQTPALYAAYVKVAHEFHLPFMALRPPQMPPQMMADLGPKDIVLDHLITAAADLSPSHWMGFYRHAIQNMQPGLNLMIVHFGYDNAELEAITENHPNWGAAWRQREFNTVTSPEFKRLLKENHIVVVRWKDLQKLMQ